MKNGGIYVFKFIEPKIQLDKKRQIFTNKHLRALIIPLIIEQLLILLVGIADTQWLVMLVKQPYLVSH